jgi:hypothetical protein
MKSELRVVNSLYLLKQLNPLVVDYHHSKQNGESDALGVDVTIFLRNGFAFLVQIKSSRKRYSKHFEKHPNIPVIIAGSLINSEQIAKILNEMINENGKNFFDKSVSPEDVYPKYGNP